MRKYSQNRSERIADQIHKDLIEILRKYVKDPRITWITIIEVEVIKDNTLAKVYWTTLKDEQKDSITDALEDAKGYIRTELAKCSKTFTVPKLKFIYDESLSRGDAILELMRKL